MTSTPAHPASLLMLLNWKNRSTGAYELYEARGREHGHDREGWLQAEAEILGTRQKAAA